MRLLPLSLNARDQALMRTVAAFLKGRLEERETLEWALRLGADQTVGRHTVLSLLDDRALREPWRSAWRLIEESWSNPLVRHDAGLEEYRVRDRLSSGERSGSLIAALVDLVAPRIELESYDGRQRQVFRIPRRPRTVHHILRAELTCGRTINPTFLGLGKLTDSEFIYSLANELDAAVVRALDIARRIGWNKIHLRLRRVYHVPRSQRREGTHEPDEVDRSIAPAIKLLHAVVSRLAEVDTLAARRLVTRWKWVESSIHLRLWAAMSRDARITPANEVADFLLRLDSKPFWDVHHHPEIAELRAARFMEFGNCPSKKITKRIRKGPPRRFWPRDAEAERINEDRLYWSLRELKRIEIFGVLPSRDKMWLEENIDRFEDLAEMNRLDEGFLDFPKGGFVPPNPDRSLDFRQGVDRLRSLEEAFSGSRSGWRNLPGDRARDWLTEGGNALQVLEDLKSCADAGAEFKGGLGVLWLGTFSSR